jgi:hypothetical protein
MKRNKGIYKGAVVLFIAAIMVISTLPAMADTDDDIPDYIEKRFEGMFTDDGPSLTDAPYEPLIAPNPFKTGGREFEQFDSTFGDRAVLISEGFETPWQPSGDGDMYDAPLDPTYGMWDVDGIATGDSGSGSGLMHYWYQDYNNAGWGTPHSGSACAGIYWSSGEAQDEWIKTPIMDLDGYTNLALTFYGIWMWDNSAAEDEYLVLVSTDGGSSWIQLADLYHDAAYEVGAGGPGGYGWCWNEYQVVLALPDGTTTYQIAWRNYGGGDGLNPVSYIDDVELSGDYTPPAGCDFEVVSINHDPIVNDAPKNIEVTIRNNGPQDILEVKKLVSVEEEIPGVTSEVFNDGFEGALTNWATTDNGDMDTFTLSTTRVHAGNYSMRCTAGIDRPDAVQDTYLGHAHDSGPDELIMVSPVDFTGADEGFISFWHYCTGEYYIDGGYLYPTDYGTIAIDWGLGFVELPFSMFVAYDNGWEQVTIDLGAIGIPLTSSLAIKFIWDSDPHMEYEGWYIDDVTFSRTEPPTYKLVDQMWSIQALDGFEERVEEFELPWTEMEVGKTYKICVLGQVFDPIDCEVNLDNNELCIFVTIVNCEDVGVNFITGPDRIEKCTNGTFFAEIENFGTYPVSDEIVELKVARLVEAELFFDDFESGAGNWDVWSWGTPGVVPHLTDFDAYSGSNSLAFFDDSAAGYPNVVDLMDARALCRYVFDFSDDSNVGAFLSFYANWANLAGDEWRVMIYDPISNYVLGWYGNSGVNGDFYGPSNPNGYPEFYTFDLKEQMDYWYGAYGATYGMFSNPDGSIHYECGIGFYLEADADGCVYPPGELWSGLMIDDVRVYERFCDSTQIVVNEATIDFLDLHEITIVEFEWHGDQYCNWCVCAEVDDDCDNTNNKACTEVRVSTTFDDMPTDEAGEDPWDHDDFTYSPGSNWHVVSKQENFDDEPPTDQYFWNGNDDLGTYEANTDDSLISEVFDLSGADKAVVNFDTYYDFAAGDRGEVLYSNDAGIHWYLLGTFTGYSHWSIVGFTIPEGMSTDSMQLKFRMVSDNVYQANGWYIDDISVAPLAFDEVLIDLESFEAFPPAGWTVVHYLPADYNYYGTWSYYSSYGGVARAVGSYNQLTDTGLISPEIDITTLSDFDLEWTDYIYDYYAETICDIDISTDSGSTWTNLATWTGSHGNAAQSVDLSVYTGLVQFRWRFRTIDTGYKYWRIDNVKIGETSITEGTVHYGLEDFEGGDGGYVINAFGPGDWEYGSPTVEPPGAHSPFHCWVTDVDTDYVDDTDTTLDSVSIDITTATSPFLAFYHWMYCENSYDGGNVKLSTDGGSSFSVIDPVGGYPDNSIVGMGGEPGFTGTMGPWAEVFFDLSAFIGNNVIIRWHFGSDGSVSGYAGWAIDDVRVLDMIVVENYPLNEDFTPAVFPPAGWTVISTDPETWVRGSYQATHGTASAECWWSYGEQDEYLISPPFDLSGGSVAEVTYDSWWHGSDYTPPMTDHKDVLVTGDGVTWTAAYDINNFPNLGSFIAAPGIALPTGPAAQFAFNLWWTNAEPQINRGIWLIDSVHAEKFTPGTPVFEEDVEDVTGPYGTWTGSSTAGGDWWHLSSNRAHTGAVSWWCGDDLTGTYPTAGPGLNNALYAEFDLSGTPSAPFFSADLEFYHWGDFNVGAIGYVEFSGDGGLTWNNMWTTPHTTYAWGWEKLTFDLDDYVGGSIIIRFRFTAPGEGAPTAEGWYIDDIIIHYKEVIYEDETPPITSLCLTGDQVAMFAYDPNVPPAPTSGVANTYYILDGGSTQTYAGPFTIDTSVDHTIEYWSVDIAGNVETHKTWNYDAPDTTAPTVSITSADGLYIFGNKIMDRIFGEGILAIGKLPITVSASDDVGVTMVTFDINGVNAYDTTSPYEFVFSEMHFGTLSVTVTAYDLAGNFASDTKSDITVYCLGIF